MIINEGDKASSAGGDQTSMTDRNDTMLKVIDNI